MSRAVTLRDRSNVECPRCESILTRSRGGGHDDQGHRLRRRHCEDCDLYFTTVEVPVLYDDGTPVPLMALSGDFRVYNKLRQRDVKGFHGGVGGRRPYSESARLSIQVKVRRPERESAA
jgi:hypothetical protein